MLRALFLCLSLVAACATCPAPDAAPPAEGATCARLCQDGRARGCDWARPTAAGAPCEDVCQNATEGGPIAWDLACRVGNLESDRGCASVDLCQ